MNDCLNSRKCNIVFEKLLKKLISYARHYLNAIWCTTVVILGLKSFPPHRRNPVTYYYQTDVSIIIIWLWSSATNSFNTVIISALFVPASGITTINYIEQFWQQIIELSMLWRMDIGIQHLATTLRFQNVEILFGRKRFEFVMRSNTFKMTLNWLTTLLW